MPSSIDPTRPEDGIPASKADLRANLAAAKAELDHGGFAEGHSPTNYAAATSKVSDHLAGIDAALSAVGGGSAFTALTDTPASYAGQANRYARVNADETGLEFVDAAAGGDASTTTYTPAGTGAVRRTVQAKFRDNVSVKDFGAVGDGTTDDTAAFVLARQHAEASVRSAQVGGGNLDQRASVAIYVPGGAYLITAKETMVSRSFAGGLTAGFAWVGAGRALTEIIYRPPSLDGGTPDTPFIGNTRWRDLYFSGMTFSSDTPGATFMWSNRAGGAIQKCQFHNCGWWGQWGGGFYLTGTNNNSEYAFVDCDISHFRGDPFLWSVDSDQFLNYWFFRCHYLDSDAPLVRMDNGGHVHIRNCDVSNWNPSETGAFLFELNDDNHGNGVCHFSVDGLRVEPRNNSRLLKSEWNSGVVSLNRIDMSSLQGVIVHPDDLIDIALGGNTDGATYVIRDSDMVGGMTVRADSTAFTHYKLPILVENTRWWRKAKPSDVVTYVVDSGTEGGTPIVRFRNCWSTSGEHTSQHQAVWNADIGSRKAMFGHGEEKLVTVRGFDTEVHLGMTKRIKFPIGSIITRFSAIGKPGGSSETTTATYSLRSTEDSPTTIAQVSASNPSTARAYTETPTHLPWFCDTVQTADLDIVAETNVGFNHDDLMFVIRYL